MNDEQRQVFDDKKATPRELRLVIAQLDEEVALVRRLLLANADDARKQLDAMSNAARMARDAMQDARIYPHAMPRVVLDTAIKTIDRCLTKTR